MDKLQVLRRYFGHGEFRPGQETMVDALLEGRDALGVMPTGAGKSICYQTPALMLPGIALVISPLISLMADQVAALKASGVPAAYLNSSLTPRQMELAMQRAREDAYKIIYVAPERLESPSFLRFAMAAGISLIAVDEAHCVSQWGQDFRPVYLRIADFVDALPVRPVIGAFTATATSRVREDIIRLLRLRNPQTITTGFDRPNLYFEVARPKNRDAALETILRRKQGQPGIVYCATRKAVEEVCGRLNIAGIPAAAYHAGLADDVRRSSQEDFQYDRVQVMVATNAFGMGIDKSNVRFVIHYNMPRSMEAYYQEAGRAGRDGEMAECILLYSGQDIFTAKWMINHSEPNPALSAAEQANVRRLDLNRLQSMIDYCTGEHCLRRFILRYFGEAATEDCGDCSWCTGGRWGEAESARPAPVHRKAAPPPASAVMSPRDAALFEQLRAVRLKIARSSGLPPYVVCTDAALRSMVALRPRTLAGMLEVSGMGETKVRRFGRDFLKALEAEGSAPAPAPETAPPKPRTARKRPAPAAPASPPPPDRPSLEGEDDESLADAYLSGMSIAEMAAELGKDPAEIRQRLRDLDLIF